MLVKILDRDLLAAGILKRDERGRTIEVHALRNSFGTILSNCGVSPRTAQTLMRRSKIDMTMKVYTDPKLLDVQGALEFIPSLDLSTSPVIERQSMRATGTDDESSSRLVPKVGHCEQTGSFPVHLSTNAYEGVARTETNVNPMTPMKKALPTGNAGKADPTK